jgi:hypothetical protein
MIFTLFHPRSSQPITTVAFSFLDGVASARHKQFLCASASPARRRKAAANDAELSRTLDSMFPKVRLWLPSVLYILTPGRSVRSIQPLAPVEELLSMILRGLEMPNVERGGIILFGFHPHTSRNPDYQWFTFNWQPCSRRLFELCHVVAHNRQCGNSRLAGWRGSADKDARGDVSLC